MEKLLPEQLQHLWQSVVAQELTAAELSGMQERLTDEYRQTWERALLLSGHQDLQDSLLAEIGRYEGCVDVELQRRCQTPSPMCGRSAGSMLIRKIHTLWNSSMTRVKPCFMK
jgi:hypothetical protein